MFKLEKSLRKLAYKSLLIKFSGAGVNFLLGIIIARLLGASDFGVYSVVIAFATIAGNLSSLGLATFYTKQTAVYLESKNSIMQVQNLYRFSNKVALITGVILAPIIFFLFTDKSFNFNALLLDHIWLFVVVLTVSLGLGLSRAAIIRGFNKIIIADAPELLIKPFLGFVSILLLFFIGLNISVEIIIYIQALVATTIVLLLHAYLKLKLLGANKAEVEFTRQVDLGKGWIVFLLISVFTLLQSQLPLYLGSVYLNPNEVGLYQSCVLIVNIVALGLTAVNSPLQPKLASAWSQSDVVKIKILIKTSLKLTLYISLFFCAFIMLFSENILALYGTEFLKAKTALYLMLAGQFFNVLCGPCILLLLMSGNQKSVMGIFGSSIFTSSLLGVFLIPKYGLLGLSIVFLFTLILWNFLASFYCFKVLRVNTTILQKL